MVLLQAVSGVWAVLVVLVVLVVVTMQAALEEMAAVVVLEEMGFTIIPVAQSLP